MNPLDQEVRPEASLILPEKRKRGRPRKDPSERRAAKARYMPPGYSQLHNTTPRLDPINDPNEVMIGQTVTGVVEATFEAGYLLAVRIGNSNITLRGAVFKPGHTAPVTPENDVAPHVEMIKRTDVPFPADFHTPIRRRKRRSKEEINMQLVTYEPNKGNYVIAPHVSLGGRGNTVPVVLQPVNLSNGLSSSPNQPPPHLRPTQGKPVHSVLPLAVYPPNGSTSQASESQTSSQNEKGVPDGGSHVDGTTNKPSVLSGNPDRVVKTESDIGDMNEPLFVEPLQTRHSVHPFQPGPAMGPAMHTATGRMTELLQAVQQNLGDDQVPRNGQQTANFIVNRNRDEESQHLNQAGRL